VGLAPPLVGMFDSVTNEKGGQGNFLVVEF